MDEVLDYESDNPFFDALRTKSYVRALREIANDYDEENQYWEFWSKTENRMVTVLLRNYTSEREGDEEAEVTITGCKDDRERLAAAHGRTPDEFHRSNRVSLVNESPPKDKVKEGLYTLDRLHTSIEEKEIAEIFSSTTLVEYAFKKRLLESIDRLRDSKAPDWHPGSNEVVNDILHPTLYPLVRDEAPEPEGERDPYNPRSVIRDRWGRKYRSSRYQWIPADFEIDYDKKATLKEGSFINNIPPKGHEDLVANLTELVSLCVPALEYVLEYAKAAQFTDQRAMTVSGDKYRDDIWMNLSTATIQVIPKIAEYVFNSSTSSYEGVWHFEGLSHEHIVATAVYFPRVDEGLRGGRLSFKRTLTDLERAFLRGSVRQYPLNIIYDVTSGLIPLGHVQTREDLLLLFPNSHAHKLAQIRVDPDLDPAMGPTADEPLRRTIVALFFVDPETPIPSTTTLGRRPQETMTWTEAKEIRLKMMAERKVGKEDLNGKEVDFCEH